MKELPLLFVCLESRSFKNVLMNTSRQGLKLSLIDKGHAIEPAKSVPKVITIKTFLINVITVISVG